MNELLPTHTQAHTHTKALGLPRAEKELTTEWVEMDHKVMNASVLYLCPDILLIDTCSA